MRLLFYHTARSWSGRARAFVDAARALATRGHEVAVLGAAGGDFTRRAADVGLVAVGIDAAAGPLSRARALRAKLEERAIEVVFVQAEQEHLDAALSTRLSHAGAVVRRVPAGMLPHVGWRARWARRVGPVTWLVTAPAPDVPSAAVRSGDRVVTGDLGVVLPARPAAPPAALHGRHMACLATRQARDRVREVLRTLALLGERHADVGLAVTGTAGALDELRLHAAALGLTGRVRWLGPGREREALEGASLAWVAGESDDAAFACLDAMAAGVPVFAARSMVTARYVRPGEDGELFATFEPATMAAAAVDYLLLPERQGASARSARAQVEETFGERTLAMGFEQAARAARESARGAAQGAA